MEKDFSEVVDVATTQLRVSGRFSGKELVTYRELMAALHKEASSENPNMSVMATLGQGLAELTAKVDPYEGLTEFITGGELRSWLDVLDGNVQISE